MLAGWRPYDSRVIQRRQYFANLHVTFIFIVVTNVDVSSDFFFFSASLDLQSIRDDEASNFLKCFDRCSDYFMEITS